MEVQGCTELIVMTLIPNISLADTHLHNYVAPPLVSAKNVTVSHFSLQWAGVMPSAPLYHVRDASARAAFRHS